MTTFAEGRERNLALGIYGAASGSGAAAGVLLGGAAHLVPELVVDLLHQRSGRARRDRAHAAAPAREPCRPRPPPLRRPRRRLGHRRADAARLRDDPRRRPTAGARPTTLALFGGAAALIAAFVVIELRSQSPLLPLRIFRLRTLTGANAAMAIVGAVAFSEFFVLTLYLQDVLHYSAVQSGVAFVAFALIGRRRLERRAGGRRPLRRAADAHARAARVGCVGRVAHAAAGGRALLLGSLPGLRARRRRAWASRSSRSRSRASPGVERSDAGVASGLINTSRQIGGAIGIAAVSAIAATATSSYADAHAAVTVVERARARPRVPDRALRADGPAARRRGDRGHAHEAGPASRVRRRRPRTPSVVLDEAA